MKRFFAGLTAVACLSCQVAAAAPTQTTAASAPTTLYQTTITASPVLTKTSESTAAAVAYEYHPFDENYSGIYINEFYCDASRIMIVADDGKGYEVADFTPFTDGSLICTLRYVSNVQMIRSMKVASDTQRRGEKPAFVLRLSDTAITDDITASFSATYMAPKNVSVTVTDPTDKTGKKIKLLMKSGGKVVVTHRMNVNYERLNKLQFTPSYDVDFNNLRKNGPAGVESEVLYPQDDYENSSADYCWESLGRICAEISASNSENLPHVPKLSTFWMDGTVLKKFSMNSAFIRDFGSTTLKSAVSLAITNPFISFDGEETVPHEDVIIYEYVNGHLKNVTKQFRYGKNSNGEGAYVTSIKKLGVYILSDKKI